MIDWQRHEKLKAQRREQLARHHRSRYVNTGQHFPEAYQTLPRDLPGGQWRYLRAPGEVTRPVSPVDRAIRDTRVFLDGIRSSSGRNVDRLNALAAAERAANRARFPTITGLPTSRPGRHTYLGRQQSPNILQELHGAMMRPIYRGAEFLVPKLDSNLDRTRAASRRFVGGLAKHMGSTLVSDLGALAVAGMLARDIVKAWPQLAPAARGAHLPVLIYRFAKLHPWQVAAQLAFSVLLHLHNNSHRGLAAPVDTPGTPAGFTGGFTRYGKCPTHAPYFGRTRAQGYAASFVTYANGCLAGQGTLPDWPLYENIVAPVGHLSIDVYGVPNSNGHARYVEYWSRPASLGGTVATYQQATPAVRMVPHLPATTLAPLMPPPGRVLATVRTPREATSGVGLTGRLPPHPSPRPAPSGHRFQPGGKREHKQHIRSRRLYRLVVGLMEGFFETEEKVRAAYESLPKCRLARIYQQLGRQPKPHEKAYYAWKHSDEINAPLLLFRLAEAKWGNYWVAKPGTTFAGGNTARGLGWNFLGAQSRMEGRLSGLYGDPRRFRGAAAEYIERHDLDGAPRGDDAVNSLLVWFGQQLLGSSAPTTKGQVVSALRRAHDRPCKV
jgi:hypothetical protein